MKIKTKVSIHINVSQEKVWDYITNAENFPKYFLGWGLIPAVEKIEITSGETTVTPGMKQQVTTTDGRIAEEHFLSVRKPEYFDYEIISGFGFPFGLFVKKGGASWTLAPNSVGIALTWDYSFDLTSFLVYPVGVLLVKFFFKNAMASALDQIKKQLEN